MLTRILKEIESAKKLMGMYKGLSKQNNPLTSETIPARFIRLFETHGVHRNQIPRFFGHALAVADVKDDETLIPKLTEKMLDDACEMFAVRREWLDGAESQVHPEHDFYKHPKDFLDYIEALETMNPDERVTGVLIKPENDNGRPDALIILQEVIGYIGDKAICRFHLCNNWAFSYWKARAYLTACIAIAWKKNAYIHGISMPKDLIDKLASGETLLGWNGEGIWDLSHKTWDPEGMCDRPEIFLEGIDPEENQFGIKSALELWLYLDKEGLMDSGYGNAPRQSFEAELAKYV